MIVYNAEPYGYSNKAIKNWEEKGYQYREGSWDEIVTTPSFPKVGILIVRLKQSVDKSVLAKFPALTMVISATTGHDHLDVKLLKERKIKLVSLRGQDEFLKTIPSTAEHTWALLMAIIRKVPAANSHVRQGGWNRDLFRGYQLKNKTMGIIGYGRTGKFVASYAQAFGMQVNYYDPYVNDSTYQKVESLNELFQVADVLSFHVHLNEETNQLLNSTTIKYVKHGAILINTSRGKIWQEEAVAEALQHGTIAGVATDVLGTELVNIQDSPIWKRQQAGDNVLITPHIAGATWDAMWACEEYMLTLV